MYKEQNHKEKAMEIAIKNKLSLHRVEKSIYGVDKEGNYYLISKSNSYDDLWSACFYALKGGVELKSFGKEQVEELFESHSSRDELKRRVIEKGIKKGYALFHKENKMYGIDSEGNEKLIAKVDKDELKKDRDLLWKTTLTNL